MKKMENRLKELRTKKHLTLKELGEQLGMPNNTLSQYETGKREPKLETWQKLADFFGVSVSYLQGTEDKPNNGYSKEYIYQQLDDAYKNDWIGKSHYLGLESLIPTFYIEKYCKDNNINIPKNTNLEFWKTNFSFIFNDSDIKHLLITKDKYSDDDIKKIISFALFQEVESKEIVSLLEKLNKKYLDKLIEKENKK